MTYRFVIFIKFTILKSLKSKNIKNQTNFESKWDESTKKNSWQNKLDRMKSQQIRESYDIQPINEWVERMQREWDEHVTRMDLLKSNWKVKRITI